MLVNTGFQRATTLKLKIYTDGNLHETVNLPFMESFEYNSITYPTVSAQDIVEMAEIDYLQRTQDYTAYVQENYQNQYPGLVVTNTGSRIENTDACPLPII